MKSTSLDVNSHILFIIFQFLQIIHIFLVLCIIDLFQHLLLQNAPTQSLLSVVNGILEESVERRNGEIPHVWHWRLQCYIYHKCIHEKHIYKFMQNELHIIIRFSLEYCLTNIFASQRVACLLRKVVQEIERRISTQAAHLKTVSQL